MNCRKQDFKEGKGKIKWLNGRMLRILLFSADDEPYEIYFSYDKYYGIVYAEKEKVYEIRDEMKRELQAEYDRDRKVSNEFIRKFSEKYDVCIPSDIYFNFDFMDFF